MSFMKTEAMIFRVKKSIGYDNVEMRVKIEGVAKVVDEADRSYARIGHRWRAGDDPLSDFVNNDAKDSLKNSLGKEVVSNAFWEANHKLTRWNMGDYVLNEMSSGLDHGALVA